MPYNFKPGYQTRFNFFIIDFINISNLLIESKIKNTLGRQYWGIEVECDILYY
jgi:hypothetical protein